MRGADVEKITPIVLQMYSEGATQAEIAEVVKAGKEKVRRILVEEGVYDPDRGHDILQKAPQPLPFLPQSNTMIRKLGEAVTKGKIEHVRHKIKVGDVIRLHTVKACSPDAARSTIDGKDRMGRVIDVSSSRFCIVEIIPTGVREAVLWLDLLPSVKIYGTAGGCVREFTKLTD